MANADALKKLKNAIRDVNPECLYFFYGEEPFLMHHYLDKLQDAIVDPLTESFNFHKFNNENFSVQAFIEAVENLPMMAERTMVLVDDIDIFKLPEDEREKLGQLFSDLPEYCTVVFTYETISWKPDKRFKKLWDAVNESGEIVEFAKQEQRDLIAWVSRRFAANKKTISPELCNYLIELTGGTMTALSGEVAKICAYSDADAIKRSDIDAVTEPVLDAVVFQMTDLFTERKYTKALEKLQQLFKMQEEPLKILGAVGGHFRNIGAARILYDSGKSTSDLMQITGIREYPAKKAMAAAKRVSPNFCKNASKLIMETDYQMKTSFDSQERLLELLMLKLAQEAENG